MNMEKISLRNFSHIFSIAAISSLVIQLLRTNNSESIDKLLFLAAISAGVVVFFKSVGNSKGINRPINTNLSMLAIPVILIGVIGIEKHPTMDPKFLSNLWLGFGVIVLIFLIVLLPFVNQIYISRGQGINRFITSVIALLLLVMLIPAALQGGSSIIDTYHSEYVINELLAVPAGNLPYVDFIPQYGILFTWLIAPFKAFFNPEELITFGLYLMSAATIIAVLLGVWLVYKAMNKRSLPLAVLLVVPFTSIAKFPERENFPGSIYALISAVPGRIFYGMAIATMTIWLCVKRRHLFGTAILGFLVGLGSWINQDFVIAAGVVSGILISLHSRSFREFAIYTLSAAFGVLIYPILMLISGQSFRFDAVAFFVLQYTSGFMAEPIQTPGPVLVVLPLIVAIFFASALPLYKERFKKQEIPSELKRAILTANFFSAWSLIGFAYYLNRSYASGQMQILFLPLSIAMASFFYYVLPKNLEESPWTAKTFFKKQTWSGKNAKTNLAFIPISMLMALPLATTIAFPSPAVEYERLTNAPAENRWPNLALSQAETRLNVLSNQNGAMSVSDMGYLGNSGNFMELKTGIESLNILNSPWDLPPAETPLRVGCKYITDLNKRYILLDETGLAFAKLFKDGKMCGAYSLLNPSLADGYLWEKVG